MKLLLDTCVWIEWLCDSKLAKKFERYFNKPDDIIVPTIIQLELYKWLCREENESLANEIIGFTKQMHVVDLDSSLALMAADFSSQLHLSMADAIIYATANRHQAKLVTCDKHFANLPNTEYVEKNTSQK